MHRVPGTHDCKYENAELAKIHSYNPQFVCIRPGLKRDRKPYQIHRSVEGDKPTRQQDADPSMSMLIQSERIRGTVEKINERVHECNLAIPIQMSGFILMAMYLKGVINVV